MNHTQNLPGIQTRKAKTKVERKAKEEGLACLRGLFGD
jgi:hypothetical protein